MARPIVEVATFKIYVRERNRDPNRRPKCEHCKKTGHTRENCFEIVGYPLNWQGKKKSFSTKTTINAVVFETKRKEADSQQHSNQQQIVLSPLGYYKPSLIS